MEKEKPHALEMGKEKAQAIEAQNQKESRRTLNIFFFF
jgi:hypothetical protein